MLGTSELRRMRVNNDYLRTWVSRRGHHRVTVSQVSRDQGKFGDIRQRIVTNNHYFVCHISRAINLIYYYWFEMYSRNKNYKVKFMLKNNLCARQGKIALLSLDSTLWSIQSVLGARPIIRVEVMQFIWTLPNITRCIPPSVFVINFPYIQGSHRGRHTGIVWGTWIINQMSSSWYLFSYY